MSSAAPVWLFDLDNTLHDASAHIFLHINRSMTDYIASQLGLSNEAACTLRQDYWHRYGATLTGLVRHHGTDPHHFLHETHQFDHLPALLVFERTLNTLLRRLPGRKIIFSNAPQDYAYRILHLMKIRHHFEHIIGIEKLNLQPKPGINGYRRLLHTLRLPPSRCIMIEDSTVNLRTARRLGMHTVLVGRTPRRPSYIDIQIRSILELHRATRHLTTSFRKS